MSVQPEPALPVLIVGAGPTGLVLALWLTRKGIGCRIVDKAEAPGSTSRALALHARTLEFYGQLGVAETVVQAGIIGQAVRVWRGGKPTVRIPLGRFGEGISPYPFVLFYPQDQHEALLIAELVSLGVAVERRTELLSFVQDEAGVTATLRTPAGDETVRCAYLAGCDGGHSQVRRELSIPYSGKTNAQTFYVADVHVAEPTDDMGLNACFHDGQFSIFMPVRQAGTVRYIGVVPPDVPDSEAATFADVADALRAESGLTVTDVNWFSTYLIHHRVAERFRVGRAFLAGDAGHIHSPAGAQGMNTGIGDAVNLAWKLADVIAGRAAPALLDSYEPERLSFAQELVRSVDRTFSAVTRSSAVGRFIRERMIPALLPQLLTLGPLQRLLFRRVSQTEVSYRSSPLSGGRAGALAAGDRLPWLTFSSGDNFAPLATLDWGLQIYGAAGDPLRNLANRHELRISVFAPDQSAVRAGLRRDAVYLVRPDGHLGYVAPDQDEASLAGLAAYLGRFLARDESTRTGT